MVYFASEGYYKKRDFVPSLNSDQVLGSDILGAIAHPEQEIAKLKIKKIKTPAPTPQPSLSPLSLPPSLPLSHTHTYTQRDSYILLLSLKN